MRDRIYKYNVYGINIDSEIKFNEIMDNNINNIGNILIRYGTMDKTIKDDIKKGKVTYINKGKYWCYIENVATFLILNGSEIIVEPAINSKIEDIRAYLLGCLSGFILFQKNIIAIHSGAVEINKKGLIIVGDSGSGKSTLTTALRLQGYRLISDDISTVSMENYPIIYPGYPAQRLCEDAMDKLNYDKSKFSSIELDNIIKYIVPTNDNFVTESIEIGAICEIKVKECEQVYIEQINAGEKLDLILKNIHMIDWVENLGWDRNYFKECIELSKRIPMYRIIRPKNKFTVDEQIKLIEEKIDIFQKVKVVV